MARELDLGGRGEDANLASLGIVDEHRLAQAEVGSDALPLVGRDLGAVQENRERVAARALIDAETRSR
jgi:hypothetical protein